MMTPERIAHLRKLLAEATVPDSSSVIGFRVALAETLDEVERLQAVENDPVNSYAGFPIPRTAIECRNKEIK